jgi:SAM-dependent methyltransferase
MHDTAMEIGKTFFRNYFGRKTKGKILDLGGMDVNGSLRDVAPTGWEYVSADLTPGPGVDVVLDDACRLPFAAHEFDAVVSTSCFEHNSLFWLTFNEMCRVARDGGYIYINAPSNGAYHRYPEDCWRFYPDAGPALTKWAQRSGHSVALCESFVAAAGRHKWNDFVCVLRKGARQDHLSISPLHRAVSCSNIRVGGSEEVQLQCAETQDMKQMAEAKKQIALLTRKAEKLEKKLAKVSKKNERLVQQNYHLAQRPSRLPASLVAIARTLLRGPATVLSALE